MEQSKNDDKNKLTPEQRKIIGKNIAASRNKMGYSQEKVSEFLDISVGFYSDVERGVKNLSIDNFIALANLLNESADVLLGEVLNTGHRLVSSKLAEDIELLNTNQREEIRAIIDVMMKLNKK